MTPTCAMPDCEHEATHFLPWTDDWKLCEQHYLWLTGDTGLRSLYVEDAEPLAKTGDRVDFRARARVSLDAGTEPRRLSFSPEAWVKLRAVAGFEEPAVALQRDEHNPDFFYREVAGEREQWVPVRAGMELIGSVVLASLLREVADARQDSVLSERYHQHLLGEIQTLRAVATGLAQAVGHRAEDR